jgi:membrane associated rhomboid family serine protease
MSRTDQAPPAFNVPPVVFAVIAVLVLIHFVRTASDDLDYLSLNLLAFVPVRLDPTPDPFNALPGLPGAGLWGMLTYGLLHGDVFHLLSNCLWLLVFGTPVARRLSLGCWLLLFLGSGIGGALVTLLLHWGDRLYLIGASASISGLMAASVPIMFGRGSVFSRTASSEQARAARVLPLSILLRHKRAIAFILVFFGITLISSAAQLISATALVGEANIAWEAHLGGFIAGLLLFYALDRPQNL